MKLLSFNLSSAKLTSSALTRLKGAFVGFLPLPNTLFPADSDPDPEAASLADSTKAALDGSILVFLTGALMKGTGEMGVGIEAGVGSSFAFFEEEDFDFFDAEGRTDRGLEEVSSSSDEELSDEEEAAEEEDDDEEVEALRFKLGLVVVVVVVEVIVRFSTLVSTISESESESEDESESESEDDEAAATGAGTSAAVLLAFGASKKKGKRMMSFVTRRKEGRLSRTFHDFFLIGL